MIINKTKLWFKAGMEPPTLSVAEVCRSIGLPPIPVIKYLCSLKVTANPAGIDADSKEWLAIIKVPSLPKKADKIRSKIWSEGQRYQRRFQFQPAGSRSRPTRGRIKARVAQEQMMRGKIVFVAFNREDNRRKERTEIKQKQKQRALKKLSSTEENSSQSFQEQQIPEVIATFQKYNRLEGEVIPQGVIQRAANSVRENGYIEFLQLSCPRIDAKQLLKPQPERYILTDTTGNNFETTAGRLTAMIEELKLSGVDSFVNIVICDTDEDDYIFPILGKPALFNDSIAEQRKMAYMKRFIRQTNRRYPSWSRFDVYRWSEIKWLYQELCQLSTRGSNPNLSEENILNEMARMREFFTKGNYYDGLKLPGEAELRQIVELKFGTYGEQGQILGWFLPNAILIQNEFPLKLRTKMLNSLSQITGTSLPTIYPYGRSESPY